MRAIDFLTNGHNPKPSESQESPREEVYVPDEYRAAYDRLSEKEVNMVIQLASLLDYYYVSSIRAAELLEEFIRTLIGDGYIPAEWDIEPFAAAMSKVNEIAEGANDYRFVTERRNLLINRTKHRKDNK